MNKKHKFGFSVLFISALVSGCAGTGTQSMSSQPASASGPTFNLNYGVVESIQAVSAEQAGSGGIGVGAVAGGVVGGVLGNQVGSGQGKTAATAAGTIGGAILGHQMEQRNRPQGVMYQVGVRLDSGSYQILTQENASDLTVGSRVRIDNGKAYLY